MKNEGWVERLLCKIFPEGKGNKSFGRFDIVKEHDGENVLYLRRFRLLYTKWFGIYLHHIAMPDQDRHLHDHPWDFGVIVLKGGYLEEIPNAIDYKWREGTGTTMVHKRRMLTFRTQKAEQLHRIREVKPGTWTLFFRGPKKRHWGFQTENGWKQWLHYLRDEGIYEQLEGVEPTDPDSHLPNEEVRV